MRSKEKPSFQHGPNISPYRCLTGGHLPFRLDGAWEVKGKTGKRRADSRRQVRAFAGTRTRFQWNGVGGVRSNDLRNGRRQGDRIAPARLEKREEALSSRSG